jgi:hydroxyethylthiazole kinase-like uncharacterized protein yjeF
MKAKSLGAVYHSQEIRAWEQRWFAAGNSAFGLMQQAAWAIALALDQALQQQQGRTAKILVWCGCGNNAGDGYLSACYLQQMGYRVAIFAPWAATTAEAKRAALQAQLEHLPILTALGQQAFDVHLDALLGIGLNREMEPQLQGWIKQFNACSGFKVAIDLPSGLHPDLGIALPIATRVDLSLVLLALKPGLLIGQASTYVGKIQQLGLIPLDHQLEVAAYFHPQRPSLSPRPSTAHKGDAGHVLVIGGHPSMGGAVIMAAEAAMAAGAGKVTVMTDPRHHPAILARSPNVMLKAIADSQHAAFDEELSQIDALCFGMGLGRDAWAEAYFHAIFPWLIKPRAERSVILDADALWFLAKSATAVNLAQHCIATPHAAEAARLLGCSVEDIENDRLAAIRNLHMRFGGQWVLKGAGSLTWQDGRIDICGFGNAGMATAGMGDVLAGMMASLKAQFGQQISIADIVALHALAADQLAQNGLRGIQAQQMPAAIYQVVNACTSAR